MYEERNNLRGGAHHQYKGCKIFYFLFFIIYYLYIFFILVYILNCLLTSTKFEVFSHTMFVLSPIQDQILD